MPMRSSRARGFSRAVALCCLALGAASSRLAVAQPAATGVAQRSEAEFLVSPQGGAFEIALHAGAVCILSFPDKLVKRSLVSSDYFDLKAWGDDGVAVRPLSAKAPATTVALATSDGGVKVNVTLTVVAADKPALTMVRFRAVTAEEAMAAEIRAQVEKEVAGLRQTFESRTRTRADELWVDRLIGLREVVRLSGHARNDSNVILHVRRGVLAGENGYIIFDIENRAKDSFRLASVEIVTGTTEVTSQAWLPTSQALLPAPSSEQRPKLIGVVAPGTTGHGVVLVPAVDRVLRKSLSLTITGPEGSQPIRVDGIVFR